MQRTHLLVAAGVVAFAAWMFVHPFGIGSADPYRDNDWFTDRTYDVLARDALLHHHQLPIRSHLLGGGFPTIGHPFDGSWAPTLLPVILFGDVIGVKVNLLLLMLLGAWGMWGLARGWLGVGPPAAALAALGFAFSGWLPSMMLVGFYPQCLYLLTPALLRLLWVDAEHAPRRSTLLAGFVLFLLLQQAGNATLAVAWFVGVATWLKVAADEHPGLVPVAALLLLPVAAPLAFARELEVWWPVAAGWAAAAALLAGVPRLRRLTRSFGPHVARGLAVGVIAATLGIGKVVAVDDLLGRGEYVHELSWGYEMWFPREGHGEPDGRVVRFPRFDEENPPPPYRDPDFFMGPAELLEGLLGRVPAEGEYSPYPPPNDDPMEERPLGIAEREYMWVGLTAPLLLLALIGVVVGRRRAPLATLGVLVAGVCLGPHGPPDLHFLLVKGLPGFDRIVQPIKYFDFFFVPVLVLLAAGALDRVPRERERLAWIALPLLLAWPFVQNGPMFAERFERPVPREATYEGPIMHVGHPDWVGQGTDEIERMGRDWAIRELARPVGTREYEGARSRFGVIDWYGTVEMPERAIPRSYVTPSGELIPNPDYPGDEAWFDGGGEVRSVELGPTRIRVEASTDGPSRLVINQNALPEFVSVGDGELSEQDGRLAVDLGDAGEHRVELVWRPTKLLAGLAGSALAFAVWLFALIRFGERPAQPPSPTSTSKVPQAEDR